MKVKVFTQPIENIHDDFELLENRINDFITNKLNVKITTSVSDNVFDDRVSRIPVYIVMVQYNEL
jgi:hypothetical protein